MGNMKQVYTGSAFKSLNYNQAVKFIGGLFPMNNNYQGRNSNDKVNLSSDMEDSYISFSRSYIDTNNTNEISQFTIYYREILDNAPYTSTDGITFQCSTPISFATGTWTGVLKRGSNGTTIDASLYNVDGNGNIVFKSKTTETKVYLDGAKIEKKLEYNISRLTDGTITDISTIWR